MGGPRSAVTSWPLAERIQASVPRRSAAPGRSRERGGRPIAEHGHGLSQRSWIRLKCAPAPGDFGVGMGWNGRSTDARRLPRSPSIRHRAFTERNDVTGQLGPDLPASRTFGLEMPVQPWKKRATPPSWCSICVLAVAA